MYIKHLSRVPTTRGVDEHHLADLAEEPKRPFPRVVYIYINMRLFAVEPTIATRLITAPLRFT